MSAAHWDELAKLPRGVADARWLEHCLERNAGTAYLRRFGSPRDVAAYRERVPLVTYEDMRPLIDELAQGRPDVVFSGRPVAFERTGGSTGGTKLIPYSEAGLRDFRRALLPWLTETARAHRLTGSVYLAISPATRAPEFIGDVPVGLSDGAYLGDPAAVIIAGLSAVPFEVAAIGDVERWRRETLRHLEAAADLELISCWSPTFLLRLLDELGDPEALWPRLRIVSCWASAASGPFAAELAARLPHAHLQPKGLMSTECVVTVPDADDRPVLTSHGFFEFLDGERPLLAGELTIASTYEVVATTASGLYRYRTGDLVTCLGFDDAGRPVLEFTGRCDLSSDLVGEKLTEPFVAGCVADVPGFRVLAPAADGGGYVLATESGSGADAEHLDSRLCSNPQYAYARRLGQLRALRVAEIDGLYDRYVATQLQGGIRLGDVKPLVLGCGQGWLARLGVAL